MAQSLRVPLVSHSGAKGALAGFERLIGCELGALLMHASFFPVMESYRGLLLMLPMTEGVRNMEMFVEEEGAIEGATDGAVVDGCVD